MSVENKQVRGDASVSRNVNAGGNARVQGNMHVGHNLRVDGTVEAQNIKAANKGLFLDEAQLKARYPQPEEGWFAGVGSSSPFVVYIARKDAVGRVDWYATNGTFAVDVDMDSYNQRIDELESQVAELIEIILSGGGGNVVNVRVSVEGHGSVTGSGLYQIGNPVTLTATAENGYHFVEWQDAEGNTIAGAGATYTFEATESVTLKAVFAVSYFTVTATPNDGDLGSVTLEADKTATAEGYPGGTHITLTPTASTMDHAYFVGWSDGNTDNPRTITLERNVELTAVFAEEMLISTDVVIEEGETDHRGGTTIRIERDGSVVSGNRVRINDRVTLTATGTSYKPSAWLDGNGAALGEDFTIESSGDTMTCTFTYTGTQTLSFKAKFEGDAIVVTYEVRVQSNNANQGSVHIEYPIGTPVVGNKVNLEESEQIKLVATGAANTDYVFDKWLKNGTEEVTITDGLLTVSPSTAGLYVATFRHSGEPDFYFGVVNTPSGNDHAADYSDLIGQLTGGYLADNNKATFNLPPQKTYIILYDATKVVPSEYKVTTPGFAPSQGTDFDDEDKFYLSTKENGNVTYNTIELRNGNRSDSITQSVEITFAANNN